MPKAKKEIKEDWNVAGKPIEDFVQGLCSSDVESYANMAIRLPRNVEVPEEGTSKVFVIAPNALAVLPCGGVTKRNWNNVSRDRRRYQMSNSMSKKVPSPNGKNRKRKVRAVKMCVNLKRNGELKRSGKEIVHLESNLLVKPNAVSFNVYFVRTVDEIGVVERLTTDEIDEVRQRLMNTFPEFNYVRPGYSISRDLLRLPTALPCQFEPSSRQEASLLTNLRMSSGGGVSAFSLPRAGGGRSSCASGQTATTEIISYDTPTPSYATPTPKADDAGSCCSDDTATTEHISAQSGDSGRLPAAPPGPSNLPSVLPDDGFLHHKILGEPKLDSLPTGSELASILNKDLPNRGLQLTDTFGGRGLSAFRSRRSQGKQENQHLQQYHMDVGTPQEKSTFERDFDFVSNHSGAREGAAGHLATEPVCTRRLSSLIFAFDDRSNSDARALIGHP